jgi:hypothetical protein
LKSIRLAAALLVAACLSPDCLAQAQPANVSGNAPLRTLDTVVVSGKVSGPGLWRVYRDEDHSLWIMATLSPLPKDMEWDSASVRDLVADSQEVLWAPGYSVDVDANLFQMALLGYRMYRAKDNPDGATLRDVLDPALYARWVAAKSRYLPGDRSIERKRPVVAADALLEAAIRKARLSRDPVVYPALEETIKSNGVRSNFPQFEVKVSSDAAKAALADVRRIRLNDAQCLAATLDAIERDIPRMITNANAWATGATDRFDFERLATRTRLCADALTDADFAKKYGLPNINASIAGLWLKEAEAALRDNETTVAFVPMENLAGPDSYLAALRAKGYSIEAP